MERNTMNRNLIMDEAITEKLTAKIMTPEKYQQKQTKHETNEIERLNKVIKEQSLRIKGLEKILDIQQHEYEPIDYNNLPLEELYKLRKAHEQIYAPGSEEYNQVLKVWRAKRKQEERITKHNKQEKAIARKKNLMIKELRAKRKQQERLDRQKKQQNAIPRNKRYKIKEIMIEERKMKQLEKQIYAFIIDKHIPDAKKVLDEMIENMRIMANVWHTADKPYSFPILLYPRIHPYMKESSPSNIDTLKEKIITYLDMV